MCGIAGYLGPGRLDEPAVLAALRHRGPDASGRWETAVRAGVRLQFLHTRLKVLDLSEAAAQPMVVRSVVSAAEPEAAVVAFNGEIYNYRELRAELAGCGHVFRSTGDTEVLLRGYLEWGDNVWARLDGMFAAAVYDGVRQRLVLARDHAGIKPLYHARTADGGLVFASEVRAILHSGRWTGGVDRAAVAGYLRLGAVPEPRTLWTGIEALPAGHWAEVWLGDPLPAEPQLRAYWRPEQIPVRGDVDETAWRIEHAHVLRRTVADQLASDVPIGVYLSGGVDSTLLTELAGHYARERLAAFTLAGTATENDEAAAAAATARRAGVPHQVVTLGAAELGAWVHDALAAMDQPSSDGTNAYLVSRASRAAGLVVALAGTGADEVHGAYGRARRIARWIAAWRAGGPVARALAGAAAVGVRMQHGPVAGDRVVALARVMPSPWRAAAELRRYFTWEERAELWPAGAGIEEPETPPFTDEAAYAERGAREQVRLAELAGYLRNTLLRDADAATMANSQELRVPFLGRRYLECVLGAPEEFVERGGGPKPRLTELLSTEGRRTAAGPKRGFVLDHAALLRGPLRETFGAATARLNDELGFALAAGELLDRLAQPRAAAHSRRLWALLALGFYLGQARRG